MGAWDPLYRSLPTWAQHAAVSAFGVYWRWLRFGPGYERRVAEYLQRESLSREEWKEYQAERLQTLLPRAADRVPYYRSAWSSREKRSAAAGHLQGLPVLEKDPIRRDPSAFLAEDIRPRRPFSAQTSGTTGTPIRSLKTIAELRESMALREARSARWAGVSFGEPRATFSGRIVVPDPTSRGPFYRYNAAEKQVYLSAFHLRPDTASGYLRALARHRVTWLTGYAVSYYLLARYALETGLRVPPLKAVITTSEKVTEEMRRVMETAYGCPVFEEYSNVENAFFASECPEGRLHASPDAGIIEILRPDGSPCAEGEVGEVVATGLIGDYQPLIRYRIGDLAAWGPGTCPCGRAMPILAEVVGRIEDVVTGPDGRQMVRFHGIFVDQPHVREGQIVQETLSRFRVRVVTTEGFGSRDVADIIQRMRQRLGPDVQVVVETVSDIPRTAAGKVRAVISLLGSDGGASESVIAPEASEQRTTSLGA